MVDSGPKWKREVIPDHKVRRQQTDYICSSFELVLYSSTLSTCATSIQRHSGSGYSAHSNGHRPQVADRFTDPHRYFWIYLLFIKSFAVYVGDIFTAVTMLSTDSWQNAIFDTCPEREVNGCVFIPFNTAKILFCSCILFSFLLVCVSPPAVRVSLKRRRSRLLPACL